MFAVGVFRGRGVTGRLNVGRVILMRRFAGRTRRRAGLGQRRFARGVVIVLMIMVELIVGLLMRMNAVGMLMVVRMLMTFVVVMTNGGFMGFRIVRRRVAMVGEFLAAMIRIMRLWSVHGFRGFRVDKLALHPLAVAAAPRIAMPWTTVAAGAVFGFFLG